VISQKPINFGYNAQLFLNFPNVKVSNLDVP